MKILELACTENQFNETPCRVLLCTVNKITAIKILYWVLQIKK